MISDLERGAGVLLFYQCVGFIIQGEGYGESKSFQGMLNGEKRLPFFMWGILKK